MKIIIINKKNMKKEKIKNVIIMKMKVIIFC